MYKTFTARELAKAGFKHRTSEDFRDDGTSFKGYVYHGVVVTYVNVDGTVYLSARTGFSGLDYNDYSKLPSYSGLDEFNGVNEWDVDLEKLKANIDAFRSDVENAQTILAPIKKELYAKWTEYQRLIAKYDWAVEGFLPPADCELSREAATEIRENLVKLAAQIRL